MAYLRPNLYLVLVGIVLLTNSVSHAIVVTCVEQPNQVVCTSSGGTIDLTGLTFNSTSQFSAWVHPNADSWSLTNGPFVSPLADMYTGITKSGSYGSGSQIAATSGSGPILSVFTSLVAFPAGFVSGNSIGSSTAVFQSPTANSFAELGMTPNSTLLVSWGAGGPGQSISFTPVPEPSPGLFFGLIACVLAAISFVRRFKS